MQRWIRTGFRLFVLLLVVAAIGFFTIRSKYYDVIISLAQTRVTNATSDLINDAVSKQISAGAIAYENIVYFEKDVSGRITALKTNIAQVNMLKTETLDFVNETLLDTDNFDIGVPIGSMVFPEFLSGRGPQIPVQIMSIRNSDAGFESNFTQAGIKSDLTPAEDDCFGGCYGTGVRSDSGFYSQQRCGRGRNSHCWPSAKYFFTSGRLIWTPERELKN